MTKKNSAVRGSSPHYIHICMLPKNGKIAASTRICVGIYVYMYTCCFYLHIYQFNRYTYIHVHMLRLFTYLPMQNVCIYMYMNVTCHSYLDIYDCIVYTSIHVCKYMYTPEIYGSIQIFLRNSKIIA